jgi:hypothetical protein
MSVINDEAVETLTVASGGVSSAVEVNTSDNGEELSIFVDDAGGGAPADFTVIVERYSPLEDRWMEFGRTSRSGVAQQQSFVDPAIPSKMRVKIQNDSASSDDFRVNVVSA